jgi:hypothetical protein
MNAGVHAALRAEFREVTQFDLEETNQGRV